MKFEATTKSAMELNKAQAFTWYSSNTFENIPPYFLTHWKTGKRFFLARDTLGAFEETRSHLILSGMPLSLYKSELSEFLEDFKSFAKSRGKKICGYNLGVPKNHKDFNFKALGTSISVSIKDYDLQSSKAKEVRRSLRKGKMKDYEVIEDFKDSKEHLVKLDDLLKRWRTKKLPLDIRYLLSLPKKDSSLSDKEKWYAIEKENKFYAFCSLLPFKKDNRLSYYVDHLIYDPNHETHALSFLISHLIEIQKNKGIEELDLGLNPFAEIKPHHKVNAFFRTLYKNTWLYSPSGLHYFKKKFSGVETPEFYFYEKGESHLSALYSMAKLIRRN